VGAIGASDIAGRGAVGLPDGSSGGRRIAGTSRAKRDGWTIEIANGRIATGNIADNSA